MFEYDSTAPLNDKILSHRMEHGLTIEELTYDSPIGAPVMASLMRSSESPGPGIIFLHWGFGDRTSFRAEAMAYSRHGATSLLIDAPEMGERGKGLPRIDQADIAVAYLKRCVVDVRRGVDLLLDRGISPNRLAYVGHSLGAAVGGPLAGVETRIAAFVLMAGVGDVSHGGWNRRPDETYHNQLAPYDGTRLIGSCSALILFQFGSQDDFVDRDTAERYIQAAPTSSEVRWYDADHRLSQEALRDRASWLANHLDLEPIPDEWVAAARLPRTQTTKYLLAKPAYAFLKALDRLTT